MTDGCRAEGHEAGKSGEPLSACPHRPGSGEWKNWQTGWVRGEWERLSEAGAGGATHDDKEAVGLPRVDTKIGSDQARRLADYPEPWRTEIERRMRIPPKAAELQCPWCRKQYKRRHAFVNHVEQPCGHSHNPDAPMYTEGRYDFYADSQGRWGGSCATEKQQQLWADAERERQDSVQRSMDRFGVDVLAAAREGVRAAARADIDFRADGAHGQNTSQSLAFLQQCEANGWRLVRVDAPGVINSVA